MESRQPQKLFLEEDPTFERRWQALSLNTRVWFERWAQASGGDVSREDGIMWTHNSGESSENAITISSFDPLHIGDQMDRILNEYRCHSPVRGALCWYLASDVPTNLEAKMFARGFEFNWQPHWMWCDLRHLQKKQTHLSPFTIQIIEDEPYKQADDIPYYNAANAAILTAQRRAHPELIRHLAAFQDDRIVGRCILNVTGGEWGIAGLFAMGVIPSARKRGIGTALVQAACEYAQQMGCYHVVLNATAMGEPVYRRVGFESMGHGHTWYLRKRTLIKAASTKNVIAFLEAVGQGDIVALNAISLHLEEQAFYTPLASSLTPLDIAVHCHQPAAAEWLVKHGAPLDLISAWDLGWKDQIPLLLASNPALVNVQRGNWQLTPLHVAVERGDIELVKLLLTVPNDLEIKDTEFEASALGWAHYSQRSTEIIPLIQQHLTKKW